MSTEIGSRKPATPPRDPQFDQLDPLRPVYRERVTRRAAMLDSLARRRTALLCIDLQLLDAAPGIGVFAGTDEVGVPAEAQAYYFDRLARAVLPNVRSLQDAFRRNGLEIVHTRIQSLTRDGRDRSPAHKRLGLHAPPGSREADFLPEVAPDDDEIVINKTASGVFTSTNLEYVLRNLEITGLYVVGVYTNECVSTAVRDASDLGFYVTLVEDACATVTPDLHESTIRTLRDRYARVLSTREALEQISERLDLVEEY